MAAAQLCFLSVLQGCRNGVEGKRMCGAGAVCFSNVSVTAVGSEWRRKEAGELCCAQRKSACVGMLANDRIFS